MSTNAEKIVKYLIKTISKVHGIDYSVLKNTSKKIIKLARNYDEQLLGTLEELLDLNNISSEKELAEFDIETLKLYSRIKDIEYDDSYSDKIIRKNVWAYIEEEMDAEGDSEEDDSEEDESDEEEEVKPRQKRKYTKRNIQSVKTNTKRNKYK